MEHRQQNLELINILAKQSIFQNIAVYLLQIHGAF